MSEHDGNRYTSAYDVLAHEMLSNGQYLIMVLAGMKLFGEAHKIGSPELNILNAEGSVEFRSEVLFSKVAYFREMANQTVITRSVAAFDLYLTSLLRRIFREVPGTLCSSKSKASYKQILEFSTIDEFIKWAADRRVHYLSYKGLKGIASYFDKRHWAKIDLKTDAAKLATEYIEVRNIIEHNGARVSDIFLDRTKRKDLKNGDLFPLDSDYAQKGMMAIMDVASEIDRSVISHFKLVPSPSVK